MPCWARRRLSRSLQWAGYPPSITQVQGAAIWMQYLTAYGALVKLAGIGPEDFVVITAASSSVGLAAIQIANAEGAKAIATTRTSAKRAELISLGADHVIATDEENLVQRINEITAGKGARIVFDPVGGPLVEQLAAATVATRNCFFEYGWLSFQPTPFPMAALGKGISVRGYSLMEIRRDAAALKTATKYVYDRLADGRFVPEIAKTFPLEQAADAYRYLESECAKVSASRGGVVITKSGNLERAFSSTEAQYWEAGENPARPRHCKRRGVCPRGTGLPVRR